MLEAPRCFVDAPGMGRGEVILSPEETQHLTRVRRVGVGEAVVVLNGRGDVGFGRVIAVGKREARVMVEETRRVKPARPRVTLCLGGVKQAAWDEVLRHAAVWRVNRVVWLQCAHAVAEVKGGKEERKRLRWRERLIQACKQSANPWLPELEMDTIGGRVTRAREEGDLQWVAALSGEARQVGEEMPERMPEGFCLWVGPEGDFSEEELGEIQAGGAVPVTLGPTVLRSETAALALTAVVRVGGGWSEHP